MLAPDVMYYPPVSYPSGYRVVMRYVYEDENYCICVGDSMYRVFTADTLPPDIKLKVAIINAVPEKAINGTQYNVYNNVYGPEYEDIGWRSGGYYCLVMSLTALWELRGEAIHDTGREGKEKG
jgi:hypothetical protein